jgi:hypothetical protein
MVAVTGTLAPDGANTLTAAQIGEYASKAGFTGNDLKIAVAVALAESGGNANSHNSNSATGDDSYGLWQINYYGDLKADRTKSFGPGSGLFDPQKNADAAYQIFKRSGWDAWSTYKNNDYKQFMSSADLSSIVSSALPPGVGAISDAVSSGLNIGGSINALGSNLLMSAENIGGIIFAIAFIILGVVLLARKQVANVLPTGKALKIAKQVIT